MIPAIQALQAWYCIITFTVHAMHGYLNSIPVGICFLHQTAHIDQVITASPYAFMLLI